MTCLNESPLGAQTPSKQTPTGESEPGAPAARADDTLPARGALVATRPGGETLGSHLWTGFTNGLGRWGCLGRPQTDLLDS